ncbi:MAG TPA: ABC transporter permease, partial [Puia sp.]|nr:ABC transporter permease [Puia sp.]
MLKNHLRTAWRHLRKEKGFSAINIFGLALGLAACIFITLFVVDELSYDRYNTKADRIFRVESDLRINGGTIEDIVTPPSMAAALKKDFPAVENAVRIRSDRRDVVVHLGDKVFLEPGAVRVDSTLFEIFTLPLIAGNPHTALSSPNSLVLSATAAKRFFNTTDVLGRLLKLDNDTTPYMVTGVMQDIPAQSHFHFNLIKPLTRVSEDWINFFAATYILVRPGTTAAEIDKMLIATVDRYVGPQIRDQLHTTAADLTRRGDHFRYYAMPLTRIHLYSNLEHEFETNGNFGYVVLFIVIAGLTLLIAAVNFVNLTTARSLPRLREIGVRKIMGSNRWRLA